MLACPASRGVDRCYMVEGTLEGKKVYLTTHAGTRRWEEDQNLACEHGGFWLLKENAERLHKEVKEIYGEIDVDVEKQKVIEVK